MIKRIAVIGPESSGKTTISKFIKLEFGAKYIAEYAREYLMNLDDYSNYSVDDLVIIAKKQFYYCNKNANIEMIVCDTEILTIKIWAEDKFAYCPEEIDKLFQLQEFDLYILCKPDIEWEPDPLREDKDRRDVIYEKYKLYCVKNKMNYVEIEGDIRKREEKVKKMLIELNY